jgi:hypothetical protein
MKAPKKINYPVRLGKKGQNLLYSQEGEIRFGRWFNTNQTLKGKSKWVRVAATGSLVDRSIGGIAHSKKMSDYAVMTFFSDPLGNVPRFDMVPIDSTIFDTESVSEEVDDDFYGYIPYPTAKYEYISSARPMAIATAILGLIILSTNVAAK